MMNHRVDDLPFPLRDNVRIGEVVQFFEALIFEREDIEAGFFHNGPFQSLRP
jgi:hypothetical protein